MAEDQSRPGGDCSAGVLVLVLVEDESGSDGLGGGALSAAFVSLAVVSTVSGSGRDGVSLELMVVDIGGGT